MFFGTRFDFFKYWVRANSKLGRNLNCGVSLERLVVVQSNIKKNIDTLITIKEKHIQSKVKI